MHLPPGTECMDTVHARRSVEWGDDSTLFYLTEDEEQRCARAHDLVAEVLFRKGKYAPGRLTASMCVYGGRSIFEHLLQIIYQIYGRQLCGEIDKS